jgi:hypothetical protein
MTGEAAQPAAANWTRRFLLGLVVVVFVAGVGSACAVNLWRQYNWFYLPGPNTVGEAGKVYFAHRFAQGESIFTSAKERPYYASMHGALLHASVGLIAKGGRLDVTSMYYVGRSISLLATLVALGCIAAILSRLGASRWWIVPVAMAFFASETMTEHAVSYRPDHWNLALSTLCCWLLVRGINKPGLIALMAIPAVAFFIKAPGLALVLPIAIALGAQRRWKNAVTCVVVPLLLVAVGMVMIEWASDGRFSAGMKSGLAVPIKFEAFVSMIVPPQHWIAWLIPIALIGRGLPVRDEASRRWFVVSAFAIVAFIVSGAASTRVGSNTYYFVDSWLYGLMLLGAWIAPMWRDKTSPVWPAMAVLVMIFSFHFARGAMLLGPPSFPISPQTPMDIAVRQTLAFGEQRPAVAESVNRDGQRCYSDDPGLNVLLDQPQVIYPLMQAMMIAEGSMSIEQIIAPVREHEYDLILLTGMQWQHQGVVNLPPPFVEAINRYYQRVREPGLGYQVFVPRR